MEWLIGIIILGLCLVIYLQNRKYTNLAIESSKRIDQLRELQAEVINSQEDLGEEREKNRFLLSQKKSSETRLGQISEHLVPFLENCTHDPKSMRFLGSPIDFIIFNFDEPKIVFLEVKSGNSKPSKRQKLIKNIIKSGRVYYEEIRINEKGVKNRVVGNDEGALNMDDNEEGIDDTED